MSSAAARTSAAKGPAAPGLAMRTIFIAAGSLLLLVIAIVAAAQSAWFAEFMKERIIVALQRSTGGKIQVASAAFHWRDGAVDLGGVVLSGAEPSGEPSKGAPLFAADRIHVQLPLSILWNRVRNFGSVEVVRPRISVIDSGQGFRLPAWANFRGVERLHARRLRVRDGTLQLTSEQARGFDLDASGVQLVLSARWKNRYTAACSAESVRFTSPYSRVNAAFEAEAELDPGRMHFKRISLRQGHSNVLAAGDVYAPMHGALTFQAHLDAADLSVPNMRSGDLDAAGVFELPGAPNEWLLRGSASGRNIEWPGLAKGVAIQAQYTVKPQIAHLESLRIDSSLGYFDGSGDVDQWTRLSLSGNVRNVSVRRIVAHWSKTAAWTGIAAGTVGVHADLRSPLTMSQIDVNVHVMPVSSGPGVSGVPLQGTIVGSYVGRGNAVRFDHVALESPGMQFDCSGTTRGALTVHIQAANALDLDPLFVAVAGRGVHPFENNLRGARMRFDGTLQDRILTGTAVLNALPTGGIRWTQVRADISASSSGLKVSSADLTANGIAASVAGTTTLRDWMFDPATASFRIAGKIQAASVTELAAALRGAPSGVEADGITASFHLDGSLPRPSGDINFRLNGPRAFGQHFTDVTGALALSPGTITLSSARLRSGHAMLAFSGVYAPSPESLRNGKLTLRLDTTGFPTALNGALHVTGDVSAHSDAVFAIEDLKLHLRSLSGTLRSPQLLIADQPYKDVSISATTDGQRIAAAAASKLMDEPVTGNMTIDAAAGYVMHTSLHAHNIALQTVARAAGSRWSTEISDAGLTGSIGGDATVEGPLLRPDYWSAHVNLSELNLHQDVAGAPLELHNTSPVILDVRAGTVHIDEMKLGSREGQLQARGDIELTTPHDLHLTLAGNLGLQAFELFDPNVLSSGTAIIDASVQGTLEHPVSTGGVRVTNGSFYLKDVETGLTGVEGRIQFGRNRALISSLTGEIGGGRVSADGVINYTAESPLSYNLKAEAHGVRYRYSNGISVSGDSTLRLTGTSSNGLLSGDISVARIVATPEVDLGTVLASGAAARQLGVPRKSRLPDLQLDLRVESLPNLQVSTAIARDVAANIDLRVRGTPSQPRISGSILANQGDIRVFGTNYSINRCELTFENSTRINPIVDLDLETQSRGVSVDITISGTLDKLNVNYRSDPPLQPKDIIALLAVGEAPSFAPTATVQRQTTDVSALQAGANTVLGQAVTPGSNRLSKLFGITNIKIDPIIEGSTNTPQSRLTVEQQISKNVTVSYVTNLAQTSEQIFRFEWALNPQYSIVAVRDDNGEFGIDMQFKKRFH